MSFIRRYRRSSGGWSLLKQVGIRYGYPPLEFDIVECEKLIPRNWRTPSQWVWIDGNQLCCKKRVSEDEFARVVFHYELGFDMDWERNRQEGGWHDPAGKTKPYLRIMKV